MTRIRIAAEGNARQTAAGDWRWIVPGESLSYLFPNAWVTVISDPPPKFGSLWLDKDGRIWVYAAAAYTLLHKPIAASKEFLLGARILPEWPVTESLHLCSYEKL